MEVVSRAVSSIMSERLFEGDFPEGRGPESSILAAGAELVAIQSLASLRSDVQPTLLEQELRSPEKRVRGANILTVGVPDLETVKIAYEAILIDEPAECAKKRKRKGKGKLVESYSKWDKKRYGTRSEMQKLW
ncbi:hypothetical protein KY284_036404 [Solanum tuberosum]|nr:hypothetical protein KY284_036404 [Solanum tuberosum]